MLNCYEIIDMFNLEGDKVYFSNNGKVLAKDVIIEEDYIRSEVSGILYGSEFECYIVLKDGDEISKEEYEKFDFTYKDKTERYNESGGEYGKRIDYGYYNEGINLSGAEVYILYNNYNNNNIDSYNVDIYTIK